MPATDVDPLSLATFDWGSCRPKSSGAASTWPTQECVLRSVFRFCAIAHIALLCGCPPGGGGGGDAGADAESDASGSDAGLDAAESDGALDGPSSEASSTADGGVQDATTDGGAAADAAADSGAASSDGGPTCGFDAGSAPDGAAVCGDGWRDPTAEECDDGLGNASATRRGCSTQCQVLDELAAWQTRPDRGTDGGLSNAPRALGMGRQPIAASDSTLGVVYLEPFSNPLTLSLATCGAKGAATGIINPFSTQSTVVDNSNPVVAGLPCGQYAVAWADLDSEGGDELDIAISLVNPSVFPTSSPAHANTTTSFSQFDPDIVWTGSQLVVAWVDTSDAATQPDLRFRTFDGSFNPTSAEQTLAGTADSEADVALATCAGMWAAAWRDDANGLETVRVQAGTTSWTVGPAFLPAPDSAKPALTALDATHLLVVYAVGVDDADSGVASGSQIMAAVLDMSAPGAPTTVLPVPANVAVGLDQSSPAAVDVQGSVFIAWWTAAALGDPNGEQLWLKQVGWNGTSLDLTAAEIPLPRWPQARLGDQELPALASSALPPGGALVTGWNDFGGGIAAGEGQGDVVVELIPTPVLRGSGDGGP